VLTGREADIARDLIPEIAARLEFLEQVGLGYLTLDRGAPTLSGGEAQRIRLAAQLGSNLQGVCYVLDEPTIGLHARDNQILLAALKTLSDKGNTLVVVEHDEDTIRRADHVIDIGPSAGKRGGRLVAQGSVADLAAAEDSQTGRYLLHAMRHPLQPRRVVAPVTSKTRANNDLSTLGNGQKDTENPETTWLRVLGADLHNLQRVDVAVPLRRLVAVTGVSGSGKSTLARDVLLANVAAWVGQRATKAGRDAMDAGQAPALVGCAGLQGFETLDRVLEVDQTPIGKTPRSCPATYIGFWDTVRKLFAESLGPLLKSVDRGRLDNLVVFAPATDGAWVDKLLAATRRLPMPPTVVMTVDGALERRDKKTISRFFFRRPREEAPIGEVPAVYDRLRQAGVELRVIHKQTGAAIDQNGIEAWRSLG